MEQSIRVHRPFNMAQSGVDWRLNEESRKTARFARPLFSGNLNDI